MAKAGGIVRRLAASVRDGFAFVELIILAAIFSIVAAFAIPRVTGLEQRTRSAALADFGHELRLASAMVHSIWLAQGQPSQVVLRGRSIELAFGYPTIESIELAVDRADKFSYDSDTGVFLPHGRVAVERSCEVTYTAPAARGEAPVVSIEQAGC